MRNERAKLFEERTKLQSAVDEFNAAIPALKGRLGELVPVVKKLEREFCNREVHKRALEGALRASGEDSSDSDEESDVPLSQRKRPRCEVSHALGLGAASLFLMRC